MSKSVTNAKNVEITSNVLESCRANFTSKYNELDPSYVEALDHMVKEAPEVFSEFKKMAVEVFRSAQTQVQTRDNEIDVVKVTQLMNKTAEFLRRPSTRMALRHFANKYERLAEENDVYMEAIGSYVQCLIKNLDPQYKNAALAAGNVMVSAVALVSDDKVHSVAMKLMESVKKNVISPVGESLNVKSGGGRMPTHGAGSRGTSKAPKKSSSATKGSSGRSSPPGRSGSSTSASSRGSRGQGSGSKRPTSRSSSPQRPGRR